MGACEFIGRNVEGGAASRTYVVTMPSSCLDRCPVEHHLHSMGVGKTHCTDRRPMRAPMNTTDSRTASPSGYGTTPPIVGSPPSIAAHRRRRRAFLISRCYSAHADLSSSGHLDGARQHRRPAELQLPRRLSQRINTKLFVLARAARRHRRATSTSRRVPATPAVDPGCGQAVCTGCTFRGQPGGRSSCRAKVSSRPPPLCCRASGGFRGWA